jgi:uncharacterized protein with ParB-like and HNH nuclease domain
MHSASRTISGLTHGVEQAEQLLADLVDFMDDKGDEPYFLGSIVLIKKPGSPEADVVDGQQRLTTLTILLAVVRDLTAEDVLLARRCQRRL